MPITTTTSTISDQYLTDIADAIRSKNGSSDTYTPPQMATAINALEVVEYGVTITSTGNSYGAYVTYDSIKYYTANNSFNFTPGDTLAIHLEVGNSGTVTIYEDGATLTSASNIINYNYTLPQHSITIALSYGMGSSSATITTAGGGSINIQELYVTPTTSDQTFNVSGIDGYKPVYVNAMPSGSATAPASINGTSATVSTGTNTLTLRKTVSVTPAVVSGYISSGTAGNSDVSLTASVTTKAAATITPSTSNQTIASGTYLTGTQTIRGDANLVAGNIKDDVTIFGVTGTYTGGGSASNFVTGTFTVGNTGGQVETVTIPYTGSGYPIAGLIYPEGGPYNNTSTGQTAWYNSLVRYAVGFFSWTKSNTTTTPTFGTSGGQNQATVAVIYKNSTSTATTYTRTSSMTAYLYNSGNAAGSAVNCVRFKGNNKTLTYYTANGTSSTYGLLPGITYRYQIIYSS